MRRPIGSQLDNGLYRLHGEETGARTQELVNAMFPEFADRSRVFAYDWLGRQFAVDFGRVEGGQPLVVLFEPGMGQALEISSNFVWFHDQELVDFRGRRIGEHLLRRVGRGKATRVCRWLQTSARRTASRSCSAGADAVTEIERIAGSVR